MKYQEYFPSEALQAYVRCYYTLECDVNELSEDKALATGCIEVMFTLDGSPWLTKGKDGFTHTSPIELWGQILRPLTFRTTGRSEIFGIRFYPSAAALLLNDDVSHFNDNVFDLSGIMGESVRSIHAQLQDAAGIGQRLALMNDFLVKRFARNRKAIEKIDLVRDVMSELTRRDFFDNIDNVAARYGISARYLQKIFVQYTGLSPKLYSKIHRFQNSLILLGKGTLPLTSIAYDAGYFDQSHFIREFRSFTGVTPSAFHPESPTAILASPNK